MSWYGSVLSNKRDMHNLWCPPVRNFRELLSGPALWQPPCVDYKSTIQHVLYSKCRADVYSPSTAFSWRQAASHQCPGFKFPMFLAVKLGCSPAHKSHSYMSKTVLNKIFI